MYDYDFTKGVATYKGACALCPYCHSFIHCGRLIMRWEEGEEGKGKVKRIISHGLRVLERANLVPHPSSWMAAEDLGLDIEWCDEPQALNNPPKMAPWEKWILVVDGHAFAGKFANQKEWVEHYG